MYNKTTSAYFSKYGKIINADDFINDETIDFDYFETTNKLVESLYIYDSEVIIHCTDGISMLCISDDLNSKNLVKFVCHRTFTIKKGTYFNIAPITPLSKFVIYFKKKSSVQVHKLEEPYLITNIKSSLLINEIFSYYYNVKSSDYTFEGETHNFYELVYVDNGKLSNNVDGIDYILNEYDLMLFGPNQFHKQKVLGNKACSYLTINFSLEISDPSLLLNRPFKVSREILDILNEFVKDSNTSIPYSGDLLICYLRQIIISLLQNNHIKEFIKPIGPVTKYFEDELINEIIVYINQNVYSQISISDICDQFSVSRSSLQNIFKENLKIAPKKYINESKLSKSKLLIKENKNNISTIALMLGFSSIHYFSRKFTQRYGITPSDYAKSIYTK